MSVCNEVEGRGESRAKRGEGEQSTGSKEATVISEREEGKEGGFLLREKKEERKKREKNELQLRVVHPLVPPLLLCSLLLSTALPLSSSSSRWLEKITARDLYPASTIKFRTHTQKKCSPGTAQRFLFIIFNPPCHSYYLP